jgi:choline dehydrogenase
MTPSPHNSFDYVIVGAGSAGCVLANRLSEDPSVQVLLLEAGPEDTLDAIRVPAIFSSLFGSEVDWNYQLEQQTHYQGSTLYPRGKTLGGSSAINLMVYICGDRADFDGWSERGCSGWDYDSVLPYFIKAENNSLSIQLTSYADTSASTRIASSASVQHSDQTVTTT